MSLRDLPSEIPLLGSLFDTSYDDALQELLNNRRRYEQFQPEAFFHERYAPTPYEYEGDFTPEMARPETVTEDPSLRAGQMSYLAKLAGLADTGLSDEDRAAYTAAQQEAGQLARGREGAIRARTQAQGMSGSGTSLALQEQASQAAAERANQAMLDQNALAAKQRALYNTAYGGALGQVRGQDFSNALTNKNIINAFNKFNTDAMNRAAQGNLQRREGVAKGNVEASNEAKRLNIGTGYQDQASNWGRNISWADKMAGAGNNLSDFYMGQGRRRADRRGQNLDVLSKGYQGIFGDTEDELEGWY